MNEGMILHQGDTEGHYDEEDTDGHIQESDGKRLK